VFAFAAWFADPDETGRDRRARLNRARHYLSGCTPASWAEQSWRGKGWGAVVRQADPGDWRWTFGTQGEGVTVLAAGFPLGLSTNDPVELGRRLLRGEDIHADVCPPFALLAVENSTGRVAVQQDWHGMGQMFLRRRRGLVTFSNRPSLLPALAGEPAQPHPRGWARYLGSGTFAGNTSPVRGVRLLDPGERMCGRIDPAAGRWRFRSEARLAVDDLVAEGLEGGRSLDELVSSVADGVARAAGSLSRLWPHPLAMGLSGGKDSRLLASMLLQWQPVRRFVTNVDNPHEGRIATELVRRLAVQHGRRVEHECYSASAAERVLDVPLRERAVRLQQRHDSMVRSTYLNRPAVASLPDTIPPPRILGAMGEYLSENWVPRDWKHDPSGASVDHARAHLRRKLFGAGPRNALRPGVQQELDTFIDELTDHARELGLDPFGVVCYGYLAGRDRRLPTALSNVEQLMPLAVREVVSAGFALTPQQKVDNALHRAAFARFVPAWADVPFIPNWYGVDLQDKVRVWHGSGADELCVLADANGALTRMLRRRQVRAALDLAATGDGTKREDALLRQWTMAATAQTALVD
jgi:asparagine synthase (glutamine-hydrolysing)